MSRAADPTMDWAVLARPSGEVLTAQAESPGLHLGLLGVPPGFEAKEAEGWLYDVIGVAHESSPVPSGSPSIPALLHHALTGLLFSHGELWERPGVPHPCSFAFVHAVHEVGFGWVGEAMVTVWVDGQPRGPEWMKVRDETGREAFAWSIPSHHSVQVRIQWSASPVDQNAGAEVLAEWSASAGEPNVAAPSSSPMVSAAGPTEPGWARAAEIRPIFEPAPAGGADHSRDTVGSLEARGEDADATAQEAAVSEEMVLPAGPEAATPEQAALPEGVPEGAAAAGGGSRFTRWLRRRFSWFTGGRKVAVGEPGEEHEAESEATSGADPIATAGEAPVTIPDLIPPTPEPVDVTRSAESPTRPAAPGPASAPPIWRGVPEHIPPSPEPAELTSRAVRSAELPDPHMIVLPPPAAASHSGVAATEPPPPAVDARVAAREVYRPAEPSAEHGEGPAGPTPMEPTAAAPTTVEPAPTLVAPIAPAADGAPPSSADPVELVAPAPSLVATPAPPEAAIALPEAAPAISAARAAYRTAPPQRPAWPSPQQLAREEVPLWRRPWVWGLAVVALFVGGWLVGAMQDAGHPRDAAGRGAVGRALHALGLGGPRFTVNVNSRPPGAWIAVDGKTLTLRTPAAVELTPGEHTVGLSFSDLGGATYTVRGLKGERVPLDATLWGALEVYSPNEVGIIGVVLDGEPRGFAPLRVDSLTPGVHEVRFSAPGMVPWGQTVDVRVGESKELLARATPSPATGVLQVQASMTDEQGMQPVKGGQVWIDGEPRGTTPLTLDLPRGPHSVRLAYKGQQAPIQVLDLPGGNQRFAVFEFGLDLEVPQLIADVPPRIPRDRPAVVSASLPGVGARDVREMWLHAQMGEGPWRRNAMTLLKASGGVIGVAVFPPSAFDAQGRARYYMSAQYGQGDESFTEIRTVQLEKSTGR